MGTMQLNQKHLSEKVVKRAFFLAYLACGGTTGMGYLQEKTLVTEEQVWNNVCNRGDYGGTILPGMPDHRKGDVYGDYVFGRMMKLGAKFDNQNGTVEFSDTKARSDYQGWSGAVPSEPTKVYRPNNVECRKYPTYQALFEQAAKDVGVEFAIA